MPKLVVMTAQMQCTMGDAPMPLSVMSQQTVKAGNMLAATIMDNAPIVNIPPFGTCKTLTASASGVPTPCVPATVAPWAPGAIKTMIGGKPALTQSCKLMCSVGGMISITSPGQTTVDVT